MLYYNYPSRAMHVSAKFIISHVVHMQSMTHGYTWSDSETLRYQITLTGRFSNLRRHCDVGVLAGKVKAALDSCLPGGASASCWASVADSTRVGYLRSFKKWLIFAAKKRCSVTTPDAHTQAEFVESLKAKEAGAAIKSTLSGIRSICKMFNIDWQVAPVVYCQI